MGRESFAATSMEDNVITKRLAGWRAALMTAAALALLGCGGGGGGGSAPTPSPTPTPIPPTITAQPQAATVTEGQAASFSVTATSTVPLTYQWLRGGATIAGAIGATYTLNATTLGDNGAQFSVIVSNSAGNVTSSAASLTVNPAIVPPSITTHPQSVTVTAGQTATFTVVAAGTAPLAYQWRRNGVDIAGATSASYTTPVTTVADSGAVFTVRVSNASPTAAVSNGATLTVNAQPPTPTAPEITTQPQNASVTAGQTATFSVAATGTAPLSYQWRRNGTDIAGATSASYTTPVTTLADNGAQFSVVVSNTVTSVTSGVATLTVSLAPPSGSRLVLGVGHVVAIRANGSVLAWGQNNVGQLGNGSDITGTNAREVATTAIAVAAGGFESLALGSDGIVRGWGRKFAGTTIIGGDAANAGTSVPSPVSSALPTGITAVVTGTGNNFAVALRNDGTVWQLPGTATAIAGGSSHAAREVTGLSNVVSLGRGVSTGAPTAIDRDGRVWQIGFIAQPGGSWQTSVTQVTGVSNAISSRCNGFSCIALLGDGTVVGFGFTSPTAVSGLTDVRSISATGADFLAVDGSGRLWTWRTNGTPTQVAGLTNVVEVAGGLQTVLARLADGSVWGYGSNSFGELGAQPASATPIQVPGINLN